MNDQSRQGAKTSYGISDLFSGKDLEIIAASLLLIGKLKVDSVSLFRDQPLIVVSLIGQFKSTEDKKENRMADLADILEENRDMTLADVLEGLKQKMNQ